ncbi:organic solvent ABC transporter permease [Marinobacter sp.]|uniref:organic solvent ABC transporter permease n=1 Tax=Marinobacter sp. TaxID=50741 RepID=UPI002355A720|nr:organic solvent ABC transporter permease [Marinobacter sp.]
MRSAHLIRLSATLVTTFALTGCLDDGGSDSNDTSVGQLNYNGFSGLTYQTQSQRGSTNAKGEFRYYPGETLSLWIGDLALVQGVPAQTYVTPLEFVPDVRAALTNPVIDDEGLSTHTIREQLLLDNPELRNITRLLMNLNWTGDVPKDQGIDIRQRVISQLNAALPNLSEPIDFSVSEAVFTASDEEVSPANQLLAEICFYPEGHPLCEEPPTLEEIELAPPQPENEDVRDPQVTYREDLQSTRDRILDSIRTLDNATPNDLEFYLSRELTAITTAVSNRYYLDEDVASHPASDTGVQSVRIRQIAGAPEIGNIEATSTRRDQVAIHATNWQEAEIDYFVAGDAGGESELVVSFRPEDTYRWIRKQLRVIIR